MDWSPFLQTALGALVALAGSEIVHRHQTKEATRSEMRGTYASVLETLSGFGDELREGSSRESLAQRLSNIAEQLIRIEVLGSQEVLDAFEAFALELEPFRDSLTESSDPPAEWTKLLNRHRGALINSMRKDLGLKPIKLSTFPTAEKKALS